MEWLVDRFLSEPDAVAFIHENNAITYGEVVETITRMTDRVANEGIEPGQVVVIHGDYSPTVFCLILALALNGNTLVPLTNDSMIEEEAALEIAGCQWLAQLPEGATESVLFSRRDLPVDNPVLRDFLKTKTAGLVLFTSGSTGRPKGILHDLRRVADKFREPRSKIVAIPFLMLDHFGGINTVLAITSSLGTVVTVRNRSISTICDAIDRYHVELLPATPSFLTQLMTSDHHLKYDLGSLKKITYGTEVMPQAILDRLRTRFPNVTLQQTYGLSEVGVLRSKSRPDGSLWLRIGGEGFETRVVDGVLWIRSDFDDDGWFNTQDRVEVDGDYFRILGRVTDIINVGGQKVYPAEVENIILGLENIADVLVYGEQHPLIGQMVMASVLLIRDEPNAALKARIRKHCSQHLARYKIPSRIIVTTGPVHTSRHKKRRRISEQ